MARRSPLTQLCEELTCSICLDYFKDPVTIPECSHNFCQGCLARCWGESEASCPLCKQSVQTRNLQPNRQLANVVAIAKELGDREGKKEEGGGRFCKKHQEPLKLFCQEDQTLICVVCDRSKEHRSHEVVPLEEVSQDYRDKFQASLKTLREERAKLLAHKEDLMQDSQVLLEETKSETQRTMAEFRKLRQFLEEQEKLLLGKMTILEKAIARKRDNNLARLSIDLFCLECLIQEMEDKLQQPVVELLQDVKITLERYETKWKFGDLVAFPPELKRKVCDVCGINDFLEVHMKRFKGLLCTRISPPSWTLVCSGQRAKDSLASGLQVQKDVMASGLQVQKATVNVTLDPDTAYPHLVLSEDRKSVRWEEESQALPKNPERFDHMACVMGCEEFTAGQNAWEVIVGNESEWAVGVARKSVRRKGAITLGPEGGFWAVGRCGACFYACEQPDSFPLPLREEPKRILVSLNYEKGRVTFLDAGRGTVLYEFLGTSFHGETLQPFFYLFGSKTQLRVSP